MIDQHQLDGMTVNERLFVSGLLIAFDKAVNDRDVEGAIALLRKVGVDNKSIDLIIKNI